MHTKEYIHTTATVLEGSQHAEHTIGALKNYLKRRGHTKLYPAILRGIERELLQQSTRNAPRLYIARKSDSAVYKEEIKRMCEEYKIPDHITYVVDPSIIGGYILQTRHLKIDRSIKRALLLKYKTLTQ